MLAYPPPIKAELFPEHPSPLMDPGQDIGLDNSKKSCASSPHPALVNLYLKSRASNIATSTCFKDAGHPEIPSRDVSRFCFLPGEEEMEIGWTIEKPELVEQAALTIICAGTGAVIWTKALAQSDYRGAPQSVYPQPWRGEVEHDGFPGGLLTVENAPYKLKMSILGDVAKPEDAVAWVYFDVLVDSIELAWGTPDQIPDVHPDRVEDDAQVLTWEKAILANLSGAPEAPATFDADGKITLDMNRYPVTGELTNKRYSLLKERWGNGPLLPVNATVKFKKSDGTASSRRPKVMGGARLVWDWADPRCDAPDAEVPAIAPWVPGDVPVEWKNSNEEFLKGLFKYDRGLAKPESYNCPKVFGGQHKPVFQAPRNGDALGFTNAQNRAWAATTGVDVAQDDAHSSILIQPSRFAGDSYRISAYLLPRDNYWEAADWQDSGVGLDTKAGTATLPKAKSGKLEVRHTTAVRAFKVTGMTFDEGKLKTLYEKQGGNDLDLASDDFDEDWYLDPASEKSIEDEVVERMLGNAVFGPLQYYVLRKDKTGCSVAFSAKDEWFQRVERAVKQNSLHGVVVPQAQFAAIDFGKAVRSVSPADPWRGMVLKKDPGQNKLYILTIDETTPAPANGMLSVVGTAHQFNFASASAEVVAPNTPFRDEAYTQVNMFVCTDGNYRSISQGATGWGTFGKHVAQRRFEHYLSGEDSDADDAHQEFDRCAGFFLFERVRAQDDFVSGSLLGEGCTKTRGLVTVGSPPGLPNPERFKNRDATIAHELGHAYFCDHAQTVAIGGNDPMPPLSPTQHLGGAPCVMNYDPGTDHFCGYCMLRLRGWDIEASLRIETPKGDAIYVPKPYFPIERTPIVLTSNGYRGNSATCRCAAANVTFYDAPNGGNVVDLRGGRAYTAENLAGGVKLYAEASAASAQSEDVILELRPDQRNLGSIQSRFTAVSLRMDVYKSPVSRTEAPGQIPDDQRMDPGRYVHLQNPELRFGRAKIVVRRALPTTYGGNVSVTSKDRRLRFYVDEKALHAQGFASWSITNNRIPDEGIPLWVEGVGVSDALCDAGVIYGHSGLAGDCAAFTVVKVGDIRASIPVTPPKTPGRTVATNPEFVADAAWAGDFDPARTLVLLNDSLPVGKTVRLTASVQPAGAPLTWGAAAPEGDYKNASGVTSRSANPLPTLTPGGQPNEAQLALDACGAYYIRAFVDTSGAGTFEAKDVKRAPGMSMNLVLVQCTVSKATSKKGKRNAFNTMNHLGAAEPYVECWSGVFSGPGAPDPVALFMEARVRAVGGGPKGRTGLERLTMQWSNNVTNLPVRTAQYVHPIMETTRNVYQTFTVDRGHETITHLNPVHALAALPLLDTYSPAGVGLSQNMVASQEEKSPGIEYTIACTDTPSCAAECRHPGRMDLLLNRVDWHIDFSAYLLVSTNLAPALFGVLHRIDWNVRAVAAVTWPGGSWTMGPDGTLTFQGAPQVTIQPGADVAITPQPLNALSPAESTPVEIGRPTLQDCQCDDATG